MSTDTIALRLKPAQLRRLHIGLAISVVLHLLVMAGVGTRPHARVQWPQKLQVFLEAAAEKVQAGALTSDAPAELAADAATASKRAEQPVQDAAQEVPPTKRAIADVAVAPEHYYTGQQLDIRAEQTNEVQLVFPERAYQMRLQGTVVVRLYISEKGTVDGVTIVEALPPGYFEQAAIEASAALKFSPAMRLGRQVKSQKTIEVKFDPYESINVP
jgi:TonB family protein